MGVTVEHKTVLVDGLVTSYLEAGRGEPVVLLHGGEFGGGAEIGVLARLVHSRFGLHVVEVVAREAGLPPSFDDVRQAVALTLRQQAWVNALRQYLQLLAGAARLEGVSLDAADSPLVQ